MRLLECGERPLGRLELLDVVRRKAERALEYEVRLAVFLSDPRRDDVSLKELRNFFENFRRDLRDIEFINQGAGDLIECGLPLESEPLGKLDLAGAGRLEFFMVSLCALDAEVGFGDGQRYQEQGGGAQWQTDLDPRIVMVVDPPDEHVREGDHQRHSVKS